MITPMVPRILCKRLLPCAAILAATNCCGVDSGEMDDTMVLIACDNSLEATRLAIRKYASEHDGVLPKAETWQDDVRPYLGELKSPGRDARMMDPQGLWGCYLTDRITMTGMAYNTEMSGRKLDEVIGTKILVFEVEVPKRNAHEPFRRRAHETSPTTRGSGTTFHRGWRTMPLDGIDTRPVGYM